MFLLDPREPVSTWTHALGLLAAPPTTWFLIQRCRQFGSSGFYQRGKLVSLLIFGCGMAFCYGASMVSHGARVEGETLAWLERLDHVGIFSLIAGTFTPVAWALMRPRQGRRSIALVWAFSLACAGMVLAGQPFPTPLATTVYLCLGWGMVFGYCEIRLAYRDRALMALPIGGAIYSVGAALNLLGWPTLIPGVFGPHELFHLFVLGGTAAHVRFLFAVVVPARPWTVDFPDSSQRVAPAPSRGIGRAVGEGPGVS